MAVTRDSILAAKAPEMVTVEVPEMGGTVYLRVISGADRDALEKRVYETGSVLDDNFSAKLLVKSICDEKGKRLFRDDEADALGEIQYTILSKLFSESRKINKLWGVDVEETKKNSASSQSEDSGSS